MSDFVVHLRTNDVADEPADVRLRRALKVLKRRFSFTALSITDGPPESDMSKFVHWCEATLKLARDAADPQEARDTEGAEALRTVEEIFLRCFGNRHGDHVLSHVDMRMVVESVFQQAIQIMQDGEARAAEEAA